MKMEEENSQDKLVDHYEYLKGRLKRIEEIEGYISRVKFIAPYKKSENDIAFYSKLENRKKSKDCINQLAENKEGEIYNDKENIMRIATNFYIDLYDPDKVNEKIQKKLLRNVKTKLSNEARSGLDKQITEKVKNAIDKMQSGKSPGFDSFAAEFYKKDWEKIKSLFMGYINEVKDQGLADPRNVSVNNL